MIDCGLIGAFTVDTGINHSCAIYNGSARCWGDNSYGKLGTGDTHYRSTLTQVAGLTSGVTKISAGRFHTCAVHNGAAKCWGKNHQGQLGIGHYSGTFRTPQSVSHLPRGSIHISTGLRSSCTLSFDGIVRCWGIGGGFYTALPQTIHGLSASPPRSSLLGVRINSENDFGNLEDALGISR